MHQRSQFVVHSFAPQPSTPFRHSTKPDTLPQSLSEAIDSRNLAFVRREDIDNASDCNRFDCVRVLVWAALFEGALVIAISSFWWLPRLIR